MRQLLVFGCGVTLAFGVTFDSTMGQMPDADLSSAPVPAPVPDPVSSPGTSGAIRSGAATCECQMRSLSMQAFLKAGPKFGSKLPTRDVEPKGHTGSAEDEWSGNDELYRRAVSSVTTKTDGTDHTGVLSAVASQGFEIYDAVAGTDPGFAAGHVHPRAHIAGEYYWETVGPPDDYEGIGMRVDGNLTASGSVTISGSVAPVGWQVQLLIVPLPVFDGFHANVGATGSVSVSANHPLPHCSGGETGIEEELNVQGNVSTTTSISTKVTVAMGGETEVTEKEHEETATVSGNLGLSGLSTLTDTAFDGSGSISEIMSVIGTTDRTVIRIPVDVVVCASGSGTADEAYAIGNATAEATVMWSGSVQLCASPDLSMPPGDPVDPLLLTDPSGGSMFPSASGF